VSECEQFGVSIEPAPLSRVELRPRQISRALKSDGGNKTMANNQDSSNRGFASMDEDKQRDIASKGGQSVPDEKRSFSQDPELAAEAGRKGGEASHGSQQQADDEPDGQQGGQSRGGQQGGNFADDRERASEAGQKGGQR
jgi:general stress protein YciG